MCAYSIMKKTCLLFDNDGTLVDSEYLCNLCIAEQFFECGTTLSLTVEQLVALYRGIKMSVVLASLAQSHNVTLPDNFMTLYRERVRQKFDDHLKPVANIEYALSKLPHLKAVVSNGPKAKIEHALELCGLRHYFGEQLFSAYDLGVYKPNPEVYLAVAEKMAVKKEQCIVIEDSLTGVEAGSRAGMTTLFYNHLNESHTFPHVTDFYDMADLPSLIEALS